MGINGELITKFKNEQLLNFTENSILGWVLIQRGFLIYNNKQFCEIFGYSQDEISEWKKKEFYKIVHHEDLKKLVEFITKENKTTVYINFRGIKKNSEIIPIRNCVLVVKYNGTNAYLSSYESMKKINNYENLNDSQIDVLIIMCKRGLDLIAEGKKLHYFESKIMNLQNCLNKIKEFRIFKNFKH